MNLVKLKTVEYPESDGQPMGETDDHRDAMIRIIELLKRHFRDQMVYVSGDLLVYYEQGDPSKFIVPDAFIAKGVEQKRRRIYRLWHEGIVPQLVIETTSRSTRVRDTKDKPDLFAKLGVHEYFLHDPTGEYLEPSLQGYRMVSGSYQQIAPDSQGGLFSEELGLSLRVTDGDLNLFDPNSGKRILTNAETAAVEAAARKQAVAERKQAIAERKQAIAERKQAMAALKEESKARQRAETEKQAAEAEIERLRSELEKYRS
jgi:Uma2 family endonuclease